MKKNANCYFYDLRIHKSIWIHLLYEKHCMVDMQFLLTRFLYIFSMSLDSMGGILGGFCFLGEQNFRNMNNFPEINRWFVAGTCSASTWAAQTLALAPEKTQKKGTSRFRLMFFGIETKGWRFRPKKEHIENTNIVTFDSQRPTTIEVHPYYPSWN